MSECQFYQQYAFVTALIPIETKLSKDVIIWVKTVAAMTKHLQFSGNSTHGFLAT